MQDERARVLHALFLLPAIYTFLMAEVPTSERLDQSTLAPLLAGTIFAERIHWFGQIPSTNSAAMQAAASGEPEGSVFMADQQLQGRGRSGHGWHSASGSGIYMSVILRPLLAPADALWLSLITGLAVQTALAETVCVSADLRWPNDILLRDKKLGGILTELSADTSAIRHAVIGIGINVNQVEFPPEISSLATSLRIETDRAWPRAEIAAAILRRLDREYLQLARTAERGEFADIIARFEAASSYARNLEVHVEEEGGYTGMTAGLDERGFLRVRTSAGVRTVISGGVRKLRDR